jgi:pyruvate-formate lyase
MDTALIPDLSEEQTLLLDLARRFTTAFQRHQGDHVAIREAACLAEQYPTLCRPIQAGDRFAGRRFYHPLVGFSNEINPNGEYAILGDKPGYQAGPEDAYRREHLGISNSGFCHNHARLQELAGRCREGSAEQRGILELIAFWDQHSMRHHYNAALSDEILQGLSRTTGFDTRHISGFMRQDCFSLDYDKLLRLGLPGLCDLIESKRQETLPGSDAAKLYTGMLLTLDVLRSVCLHYERQARAQAECCTDAQRCAELQAMADALLHLSAHKPQTLRQAIQLFWLYNLLADSPNYGRMDIYPGDFYCADLDSGRLSPAAAEDLLVGLWLMIADIKPNGGPTQPNARLVIGGRGRRNEANANRFALAALDVVVRCHVCEPNVTLRLYTGQNPALFARALDVLGQGCIHPGLYNDDEHVPMVRDSFGVPEIDAEQYVPEGCGEILIDHLGFGSPNNIHLFLGALDLVLHNGFDTVMQEQRGLALGHPSDFATFNALLAAYKRQIEHNNLIMAKRHAIEHRIEAEHGAFLFMSMLTDDCIARGKALFAGGVRYLGGIIETFGLTNAADSLVAIRELVYERKLFTLEQLVAMCDANWVGYEQAHKLVMACPKFGNDDPRADDLHTELSAFVCESANRAGHAAGLDFFLNCNLNPGGLYYSPFVKASPDGRFDQQGMPLGNAPNPGCDRQGITALLNSLSKHVKNHAGYVQNLKLNKTFFCAEHRPRLEAILDTYFANGGLQLMITALGKDDLENALKEPEKYQHLLVRVAGWTGRFLELQPKFQQQIMKRTMYS